MFLDVETTFRHTVPSSDLLCLPPGDPRVLCANTGIRLLATHSFKDAKFVLIFNFGISTAKTNGVSKGKKCLNFVGGLTKERATP